MKNVLVCVTKQATANQVIDYAVSQYSVDEAKLHIVHIGSYEMYYMNQTEEEEELSYLYERAVSCGAALEILRSNNYLESIGKIIAQKDISHVIMEDVRELRQLKSLESHVKKYNLEREIQCTFLTV